MMTRKGLEGVIEDAVAEVVGGRRQTDGVDAQRDLENALDDLNAHGGTPNHVEGVHVGTVTGRFSSQPLKNSFRDELEVANESAPPLATANESAPRGRVLVRGGRRPGRLLRGEEGLLVKAPPLRQENRPLRVGDFVRALGFIYRVRKITRKDIVLRPARPEELK